MVTRFLACFLACAAALPAHLPTPDADIVWQTKFDAAFAAAVERDTIVFLAVNMDGERANDTAAKKLYRDKAILPLALESVNCANVCAGNAGGNDKDVCAQSLKVWRPCSVR